MKSVCLFLAALWIMAGWMSPLVAHAAEAEVASPAAQDPFGQEDPFTVIEGKPQVAAPDEARLKSPSRGPQARAEVFIREFAASINDGSRINPDNRIMELKRNIGTAETRLTMSDHIDRRETVRWLFKGFAASGSYLAANGAQRQKEARVDELFADWKGDDLFASIGKRRVNWGHAQGFNPVNVIAPPRDPINPGYQTEGQPMAWGSHRTAWGSMDVILTRNFDADWNSNQNRWGLKWGGAGADTDYALYYFDGGNYADGRPYERMAGASFATVSVPGITLYMEAANFARNYRNYYAADGVARRKDDGYFQGVAGLSLGLGGRSGFFAEYFHNGQGYSAGERANYFRTADARLGNGFDPVITGDFVPLGMDRNYLLANFTKEFWEKYTFGFSSLLAGDGSSSTRAEIAYAVSDYYELRAVYLYNEGDSGSEFGNSPYKGLFEIGIKASF
ncbi:MAG: hypothetical protein HZA03_07335 [Nitrospinae bacterium]|nr:hypothetical protein [Nitrospinota bacterium]